MYTTVLIIDFGSKSTQLLARRVRELGIYSAILPCTAKPEAIAAAQASAIILSGGSDSTFDADAPAFPASVLNLGVPILALGFGMLSLANHLGATCTQHHDVMFQEFDVIPTHSSALWSDIPHGKPFAAWMAQADHITTLPETLQVCATDEHDHIVAFASAEDNIYGLQFQPEHHQTKFGSQILSNFLFTIAGLKSDWDIDAFINRTIEETRQTVGTSNVVLGLSGGVDSTVVAAILHKAIGKQLHCIFVDTGLMRHNEANEVVATLTKHIPGLQITNVQAQELFLGKLAGVENPEEKRKIIGHTFIDVFEQEAKKISNVSFLGQGTVYPDIIESYSPKGVVIKSHHNVGGLPEKMNLRLIEPLKELFKDEVRTVAEKLNLPEELVWRHPFPGPGLAVRILGDITPQRLEVLRAADRIVIQALHEADWYRKVWQAFAVLLPLRTVGLRESARTYENVIALRIVNSVDAMTADWARIPPDLLATISHRIINEVEGVNRVVYDISSKPPSTIEWE